jgi:hypothetical protein
MNLQIGELDVSDNLKMFGRYALTIGLTYATAKGWITPTGSEAISNLIIELVGVLIAFGPAAYAALKVDNTPKP